MLILIASSVAFTVTFSLLHTADNIGSNTLGESNRIVIISSGNSRTPITSVIPIALIGKIEAVSGISSISPEVLAPSTLSNNSIMVRGVDPQIFDQIEHPQILRGNGIQLNDTTEVMVGSTLASQLKIDVGNQLLLMGAIYPVSVNVLVTGIFHTGTAMDDEIIAPLWVGQWLRGLQYSAVSIIRVELKGGQSVSQISNELQSTMQTNSNSVENNTEIQSILSYLPYTLTSANIGNQSLNVSPNTSQEFLSRVFGLSQESVLFLSALVFLSLSVAIIFAYQEMVFSSKVELRTFKALGLSYRNLTRELTLTAMSFAVAAAIIGWMIGVALLDVVPGLNPLILAFYSISPADSIIFAFAGTIVISTVIAILAGLYSSFQFSRTYKKSEQFSYFPI